MYAYRTHSSSGNNNIETDIYVRVCYLVGFHKIDIFKLPKINVLYIPLERVPLWHSLGKQIFHVLLWQYWAILRLPIPIFSSIERFSHKKKKLWWWYFERLALECSKTRRPTGLVLVFLRGMSHNRSDT